MMARALIAVLSIVSVNATLSSEESEALASIQRLQTVFDEKKALALSANQKYENTLAEIAALESRLANAAKNSVDMPPVRKELGLRQKDVEPTKQNKEKTERERSEAKAALLQKVEDTLRSLDTEKARLSANLRANHENPEAKKALKQHEEKRALFEKALVPALHERLLAYIASVGDDDDKRRLALLGKLAATRTDNKEVTDYQQLLELLSLDATGKRFQDEMRQGDTAKIEPLIEAVKQAAEALKPKLGFGGRVVPFKADEKRRLDENLKRAATTLMQLQVNQDRQLPLTEDKKYQDIESIIKDAIGGEAGEYIAIQIIDDAKKMLSNTDRKVFIRLAKDGSDMKKTQKNTSSGSKAKLDDDDDTDNSVAKPDASKAKKDNDDKGSNNKLVIGLIVAAVVFVLAGVGAFFYFRRT